MTFKFENREQVRQQYEQEGTGYFLKSYCHSDAMPDQETEEAFAKALEAIEEFEFFLYEDNPNYREW